MAGHACDLVSKKYAILVIAADLIVPQQVVGIFVPDGDPKSMVAFQQIVFEEPLFDAPAKEEAILPIVAGDAVPDDGALRAASRVQAQTGVCFAAAPRNSDIIALLEADAVAIVIAHSAFFDTGARTTI
jgi:hypothetical protein